MGQQETYLVHNSQCVKPHSRDRLLVITEEKKKMHWVDASSTFIVNAVRQSFGMVGASVFIKTDFVKENTCIKPLYTA